MWSFGEAPQLLPSCMGLTEGHALLKGLARTSSLEHLLLTGVTTEWELRH
jgi:hypothetical protein